MEITLSSLRELFGSPQPPQHIWERQFDDCDSELRKVARKPWDEITNEDLWYYFHDLSYVGLQRNLFEYLFPVCLHFWYQTLMNGQETSQGDADFQRSLLQGRILTRMLDEAGREKVYRVIHDGFLHRLNQEHSFPSKEDDAFFSWIGWMGRFNSTGCLFPIIDRIWESWWRMETRGRAVCTLIWSAGLIYGDGPDDVPLFWEWNLQEAFDRLYLHEKDAFFGFVPWMGPNIEFLSKTLSSEYLHRKLLEAAQTLETGYEHQIALEMAALAHDQSQSVAQRIEWLIETLG